MSRLNSYHLPPDQWPGSVADTVPLTGPEARHLLAVLRAKPGDAVRLFDGAGRWGLFQVIAVSGKAQAVLQPQALREEPRPVRGLTLALGWNKTSRRDWLLEKSVELGAQAIWFWQAVRSQGALPAEPKDSWREKLVQAAKQCGAVWLPELAVPVGGAEALVRVAANFDGCYMLHEGAGPAALIEPEGLARGRVLAVLGPEGGLDAQEAEILAQGGFQAASLGPQPLRWETAALLCLGLAQHASLKP